MNSRCPAHEPDCGARALARVLEVGNRPHVCALHLGHDLASVLAGAEWAARRVLWVYLARWLPDRIEARSPARPELGDGWVLDRYGRPMEGAAYPLDFARDALAAAGSGPLSLVAGRRHPARSRRGCIAYADRLWILATRALMQREAEIARREWLAPRDEARR